MTASLIAAFYDSSGTLKKIVIDDTDNFTAHNESGLIYVTLPLTEFNLLPAPYNINGTLQFQDLNKAVVAKVTVADAGVGAALQAIIDSTATTLGVSAVTTPLRIGNSQTVNGVTYTVLDQQYNTVSDVAGFEFGDWPGHTGAIKMTATGGAPLITGGSGNAALSVLWGITAASAILTGARTTFSAATEGSTVVNVDTVISDDPPNLISEATHLLKSEDPGLNGADALSDAKTFGSAQTAMTADMSGVSVASGAGAINYITLGFII